MADYIINNLWQVWTVMAVLCLIIELSTGGFFIVCFAFGGVFAAVGAALGAGFILQLALFIVFSAIGIWRVRPFAMKYLHSESDARVSNADAIEGRIGTVSQEIEAGGYGRVAIDGDDWKAESADGQAIAAGERVKVVGRESIIIKVTRHDNKADEA